jgi:peroxiredoxin
MRRTLAAMLLAVPALASSDLPADDPNSAKVGDAAPPFSLPTHNPELSGQRMVSLATFVGPEATEKDTKAVLLSFFATWCKPCLKEFPLLAQMDKEFRDKGLRIISISIDKEEKDFPAIKKLCEDHKAAFPVLRDKYNLLARRYLGSQSAMPSVFMIGKDGAIRMAHKGYGEDGPKFLRSEVLKALGVEEKPSAGK